MSIHFHQYENQTLTDKRLYGTTRTLYDFMLAQSFLHSRDFCMSIRELAEGISRSMSITRFHLNKLIALGYVIRILQKDSYNPRWNQKSRFIVLAIANQFDAQSDNADLAKPVVPPSKNAEGNNKRDSKREEMNITLKREAETPLIVECEKTESENTTPSVENVPDILTTTVDYLFGQTGRTKLYPSEPAALQQLFEKHTPVRIQKEIETAVERFRRKGKNLWTITFMYIAKCLESQRSLVVKKADSRAYKKKRQETHVEAPVTQCEVHESVIIPESELSLPEAENIVAAFEPAKTNAETLPADTKALYERIKALADEKSKQNDEFLKSLPQDEYGCYVFPEDESAYPETQITLEEYLKLKYPEADEEELRVDKMRESDREELEEAKSIDCACAMCESSDDCVISNSYNAGRMRPFAVLKPDIRGKRDIILSYGYCQACKHGAKKTLCDPEYERRLKFSGLTESQAHQTFEAYMHGGALPEIVIAKAKAIRAAQSESNLILAGKAGTGKTHLAIAIAIEAMKHKRSALFRSVPELLDELRERAKNHDDFFQLMHRCKFEVSCLVLDDLGKQKTTEAGMDYLYQIIDYRYKNGKQTIVTTNALSVNELENRFNEGKIEPLLSRILENGDCAVLRTADNYRFKKQHEVKVEPEEKPLPTPTEVQVKPEVKPEQESANEPVQPEQPEERSGGITSVSGIFSRREKCSSLKEILDYRRKYGEFPPEYESLNMSDKAYLNRLLYAEYLEEQEKAKQAEKKISVAVNVNTDLWEEDEDEYRLYGDTGI